MYNFSGFKEKSAHTEDWLRKEYSNIRTGQAVPAVLDAVKVDSYGTQMQLNQVASVTVEDAKTLRIVPWDSSQIKAVEKAIIVSNLGLSPRVDDTYLRVTFPPLTGERRTMLAKTVKEKMEQAKITIRNERERIIKDFQQKEKEGEMAEDDIKKAKSELQKLVDEINGKLEEVMKKKEKEILE
ncbi:MAG: ribosome recycling factor [Candidatus Taylorbacteria bacterium RIFCSPLOWO2_12_FULL_43_20]|uniref:Ribosome-recycling factor n=1 Tax=Candidatus Taylorbacteria bacterium RIFCSPLOWO2_12_FULL_43_20 TaxID=1802332 RepID=A0A1G2P1K1_9BACT|nr:MAG: ribosome recycling factor [Candidatus Taylorbacteria bacterium RIFCSPHIGHO2_01_FULL_43_120]OHA23885.1 MAG: ribosome recycling factor [Candidatus Taylorbacteria bacterium RIFCSPHIGHO2_02_FULL_43_55]OHA28957.1 MAG: ribosome recycling factor [Candidatus Taylorbacteria bacterium RIFCSPHIGHO2_12_FULL_42_34]OHA31846.1 MAG: ribosome recycling factor [Candidatus Taylorbacteria bacterium RIFCSPLOWO2_01_FULL_43_83]OHA37741.1 MAG: ribosome recycling factor [Candidatus Taylorbacteria bacterium RIFC